MSEGRARRYDAVLFDWDDTLCGAVPHRYAHAQSVVRDLGHELSMPEVYRAFARAGDSSMLAWHEFAERLPPELGLPATQHAAFLSAYRQRDTYKTFQLFDDVLEVIEQLGRHQLRVGIVSNNDEVTRHARDLAVEHHFEIVIAPSTWGIAKPDAGIFVRALERMGVAPERALYVGDSYDNDVIGARAAGLTPVLIDRFGVNVDDLDAEHRVETLAHFALLLERLLYG